MQRPRLLSTTILWGIDFYKKHLSPHKGYYCPHEILHKGSGCSGIIRKGFDRFRTVGGLRVYKRQLLACRKASEMLKEKGIGCEQPKENLTPLGKIAGETLPMLHRIFIINNPFID